MKSIDLINYIKAPSSIVYKALTTEEGLANVWTKKILTTPETGFINEFDFDEGYLTKIKTIEMLENQKIVWECIATDEEWIDTRIFFGLTEFEGTTTVTFKHFNWKELTDYYRWCNYNWALFLHNLKEYCESIVAQTSLHHEDSGEEL